MNVVFKKRIIDQIRDARHSSHMNDRPIDRIELRMAGWMQGCQKK